MKVLMFSTDGSILEHGSSSQQRMIEYGALVEKLFIVVLSKKRVHSQTLSVGQNVVIFSAWFFGSWRLGKKFENQGINLVTAQDSFEIGLIGLLASRCLRAKLQLQIHTDFLSPYFAKESLKNKIRVQLAKWLLLKADSIRVVSERIKKSLVNLRLSEKKIIVLPIFVDAQKIQSTPITVNLHKKYPQFDFIILMASRLTREKNIGLAIRAMAEVIKTNPKVGLIIVGDGPEKKNYHLSDNIILESWTNDLASYYKTADVFLNTSNYEGYGRTLIEASAAGLPVITTDVGLVGEVINKDNSMVVQVGDKEALVQNILKLLNDKNLRDELRQKAQGAVQKLGNKEIYLEKYKQSWSKSL